MKNLAGNGLFESSRMMLPEHIKAIVKYQQESEMIFIKRRLKIELAEGIRKPRGVDKIK